LVVFEVGSSSNPAIGMGQPDFLELFDYFSKNEVLIAPSPRRKFNGIPPAKKSSVDKDGWCVGPSTSDNPRDDESKPAIAGPQNPDATKNETQK
jgi:hypothetical protein